MNVYYFDLFYLQFTNTHYGYLEETQAHLHTTVYVPSVREDQDCEEADVCEPLQWYERLTKRLRAKAEQRNKRGSKQDLLETKQNVNEEEDGDEEEMKESDTSGFGFVL